MRVLWVVSKEQRGLDFALENHERGEARKDFETNVERSARLGIRKYEPARRSSVLELDLAVDEQALRFVHGSRSSSTRAS